MDDDVTHLTRSCPRCHKPLGPDAPEGLCAACLLSSGIETLTTSSVDEAATMASAGPVPMPHTGGGQLAEQVWGPYRVGRLLGRGGMGEVYEAEHVESGRRLALKVLRSRLQQADDRARFLREGQLAASVSHPHTVYIFGSEEIAGMPVITMELLPGGTLKDQVTARGPLPIAEAVSAVLDIIGGLDAAQAAGILHRDIKPSNCFVDSEGAIKVGDFGLSISTLARDVQQQLSTEGFQGTPQFAPPEQLRGEPLDVRADIYAVGATLYYLLTGRAPFDAPDLRTLFTRVTTEPAVSPRVGRREIPSGLAAVVLQCLAKSPGQRPPSYAALADLLRPFSRRDEAPAPLGLRLVAGVVDSLIVATPFTVWRGVTTDITASDVPDAARAYVLSSWAVSVLYYILFETIWSASIGKRLFGLFVSSRENAHRLPHIVVRTLVFHVPQLLFGIYVITVGPLPALVSGSIGRNVTLNADDFSRLEGSLVTVALIALLFVTVRRHNGWAALHELASGTRVVTRQAIARSRDRSETQAVAPDARAEGRRYGPFTAIANAGSGGPDRLLIGFDPVLRRQVWIHVAPPGTQAISPARRDVSRVGRLHWLTGRKEGNENWDAFEAPDGRALDVEHLPAWPRLKSCLLDLTHELKASTQDGSLPALGLDRIWIRDDGRLVLLDFPAPPATAPTDGPANLTPIGLLSALASRAMPSSTASPALLPLSARSMIDRWAHGSATLDEAHTALTHAAASPDRVLRRRRGLPVALASVPTTVLLVFTIGVGLPALNRFFGPDSAEMLRLLEGLSRSNPPAGSRWAEPEVRTATERYLAGRHRTRLVDATFWNSPAMQTVKEQLQPTAAAIAARHPAVSADDLARAVRTIAPELAGTRPRREMSFLELSGVIITTLTAMALLTTVCCVLISAAVVPGGVVTRLLGLAVVTREGTEIGRVRSLARTGVAWLPAIIWLAYLGASPKVQGFVPTPPSPLVGTTLTLVLMAAGATWTVLRPNRGPHDRLLGTWVVPR